MPVVHFLPVEVKRIESKHSLLWRYERLLEKVIPREMVEKKSVAIKFHLGGRHVYANVHPAFVTRVVERVKALGGRPFITDHRTENALAGAVPAAFGCPVYHVTALKDRYIYVTKTGFREMPTVDVAGYIRDADALINLSHAKGHGQCGFGGAIKNLAMGCVTDRTRSRIHRLMDKAFRWHAKKCARCRKCVETCEHEAIGFDDEGRLRQDSHFCTLCLHCMTVCPKGAITVGAEGWPKFQKGLALAAKAVLGAFEKGRTLHINVALNITAICDCWGMSVASFRPDVGVLASADPVAVDKATIDLIDCASVFPGTLPQGAKLHREGAHILERIWAKDPYEQVRQAEKLGLGRTQFTLRKTL